MAFYVYILASERNGTLYIGMTDDLGRRMWEHQEGLRPGFTKKYGVRILVWYEIHETRERHAESECTRDLYGALHVLTTRPCA